MFVLLVGPKNSGKSHIGRLLEKHLAITFFRVRYGRTLRKATSGRFGYWRSAFSFRRANILATTISRSGFSDSTETLETMPRLQACDRLALALKRALRRSLGMSLSSPRSTQGRTCIRRSRSSLQRRA